MHPAARAPIIKDLVLVGGGHSHVAVLKSFGMRPVPGVRLTLVTRDVLTPYSGMLPGHVAGHYAAEACHIDLASLAAFAGARLYHDEAVGIDCAAHRLLCARRPPVSYDVLSLEIGSRPKQADIPGSAAYATPVKPIDGFAARWQGIIERVAADPAPLRIGVVGGGAGGVELLLAMQHRLGRQPQGRLRFVLVTAGDLLPTHNPRVRRILARILAERDVEVHLASAVTAVEPGLLRCAGGKQIPLDEILWVTQAGAAAFLRARGLACDEAGFVQVHASLQTVTDPAIFAAGDVAAVAAHPRPKAGVFAVRQGRPLAENLRRALAGRQPRPFVPQRRVLSLLSTGDTYAIAARGGWAAEGRWVWTLKDWIDRRFMRQYTALPPPPRGPDGHAGRRPGRCRDQHGIVGHGDALRRLRRQGRQHQPGTSDGTAADRVAPRCGHRTGRGG